MFCKKCGTPIPDEGSICPNCNQPVEEEVSAGSQSDSPQSAMQEDNVQKANPPVVDQAMPVYPPNYPPNYVPNYPPNYAPNFAPNYAQQPAMQTHNAPRCTCCGYIGEFKPGPILTKSDLLWFFLLLFLAGAGFIFLIFRLVTRADPKKREQVCPHCGATNMYTYVY